METNDRNIILKSMQDFLIQKETKNTNSVIELYNEWSIYSGIIIDKDEVMEECLRFFADAKNIDPDILKENASIEI